MIFITFALKKQCLSEVDNNREQYTMGQLGMTNRYALLINTSVVKWVAQLPSKTKKRGFSYLRGDMAEGEVRHDPLLVTPRVLVGENL